MTRRRARRPHFCRVYACLRKPRTDYQLHCEVVLASQFWYSMYSEIADARLYTYYRLKVLRSSWSASMSTCLPCESVRQSGRQRQSVIHSRRTVTFTTQSWMSQRNRREVQAIEVATGLHRSWDFSRCPAHHTLHSTLFTRKQKPIQGRPGARRSKHGG